MVNLNQFRTEKVYVIEMINLILIIQILMQKVQIDFYMKFLCKKAMNGFMNKNIVLY